MGRYLSIALTRTFRKGRLGDKPSKGTLLRVGGGRGVHYRVGLDFLNIKPNYLCWVFEFITKPNQ